MRSLGFLFLVTALLASCRQKVETVAIQPFGAVPNSHIDSVKNAVGRIYGFRVHVLPRQELPKSSFVHIKSPRYRADSVIAYLKRKKHDTLGLVLGLTIRDISATKRDGVGRVLKPERKYIDWGVFGLGYCPGVSCVVSEYRLGEKGTARFYDRLSKICIHEIGHNLGLPHCRSNKSCVMQDAVESIKTIDREGISLCADCAEKIK